MRGEGSTLSNGQTIHRHTFGNGHVCLGVEGNAVTIEEHDVTVLSGGSTIPVAGGLVPHALLTTIPHHIAVIGSIHGAEAQLSSIFRKGKAGTGIAVQAGTVHNQVILPGFPAGSRSTGSAEVENGVGTGIADAAQVDGTAGHLQGAAQSQAGILRVRGRGNIQHTAVHRHGTGRAQHTQSLLTQFQRTLLHRQGTIEAGAGAVEHLRTLALLHQIQPGKHLTMEGMSAAGSGVDIQCALGGGNRPRRILSIPPFTRSNGAGEEFGVTAHSFTGFQTGNSRIIRIDTQANVGPGRL